MKIMTYTVKLYNYSQVLSTLTISKHLLVQVLTPRALQESGSSCSWMRAAKPTGCLPLPLTNWPLRNTPHVHGVFVWLDDECDWATLVGNDKDGTPGTWFNKSLIFWVGAKAATTDLCTPTPPSLMTWSAKLIAIKQWFMNNNMNNNNVFTILREKINKKE